MKRTTNWRRLKQELQSESLSSTEQDQLLSTARVIKQAAAQPPILPRTAKRAMLQDITSRQHYSLVGAWRLVAAAMAIVILMGSGIAAAQSANPGDALYGIKRFSESVRLWFQPSYIKTLVQDRKSEVENLSKKRVSEDQLQRAEDNYQDSVEQAQKAGYKIEDTLNQATSGEDKSTSSQSESSSGSTSSDSSKSSEGGHSSLPGANTIDQVQTELHSADGGSSN